MTRHNFSPSTKRNLAECAGFHCVRPGCNRRTHFVDPETRDLRHIGWASHDGAAGENGPRNNNGMTPEQLKAYENGAWLCAGCAILVDRLESLFPLGTLPNWQFNAENINRGEVITPMPGFQISLDRVISAVEGFRKHIHGMIVNDYGQGDIVIPAHTMAKIENLRALCTPFDLRNALHTQYRHLANVQTRVLDSLIALRQEVMPAFYTAQYAPYDCWYYEELYESYRLVGAPSFFMMDAGHKAAVFASADRVRCLWHDVVEANSQLWAFIQSQYDVNLHSW